MIGDVLLGSRNRIIFPFVVIHDQFNGSGPVNGREPDTVSNGNLWDGENFQVNPIGPNGPDSYWIVDGGQTTLEPAGRYWLGRAVIDSGYANVLLEGWASGLGYGAPAFRLRKQSRTSVDHILFRYTENDRNCRVRVIEDEVIVYDVFFTGFGSAYMYIEAFVLGTTLKFRLYDSTVGGAKGTKRADQTVALGSGVWNEYTMHAIQDYRFDYALSHHHDFKLTAINAEPW